MAFKLTKAQSTELNVLASKLREQAEALETTVTEVNAEIASLVETKVNEQIKSYNETLQEARDLIEGFASDLRGEFDDKSETWQEGDRGQAVSSFVEEYESVDLTDLDTIDMEISLEVEDDASTLEALPTEPEA